MRDWDLLRVLLTVAREGSFRKGAEALDLTQPTIGKKISQLEHMVGAKAFIRTAAGASLTPVGRMLVGVAEEMEQAAQGAVAKVENSLREPGGRVRIAVTDGMAGYWLPPRMHLFHKEHPNITLDVDCIDATKEVDLSRREADITVMYKYPTDPDVVVLAESNLVMAPMCTGKFIRDWGRPKSLEDVLNFPVLIHTMHQMPIGAMKPWAEILQRHSMIALRTASSLVLGHVMLTGVGISLQPVGVMEREKDVEVLDIDGYQSSLRFYLVCHKAVKDIPSVRTAIRYLQRTLFRDDEVGGPSQHLHW